METYLRQVVIDVKHFHARLCVTDARADLFEHEALLSRKTHFHLFVDCFQRCPLSVLSHTHLTLTSDGTLIIHPPTDG